MSIYKDLLRNFFFVNSCKFFHGMDLHKKFVLLKISVGKDAITMLIDKQYQMINHRYKDYNDLKTVKPAPNRILGFPEYMSQKNNLNIERPLKTNSMNLSFKGLSFSGKNAAGFLKKSAKLVDKLLYRQTNSMPYSKKSFLEFADKYTDFVGRDLFENLEKSELAKKYLIIDGDNVTLKKKTILHLFLKGASYPFDTLPFDLLNGAVALLGKIKPLKKLSDNILKTKFFQNIRQRSKFDSKYNALRGLFETQATLEGKMEKGKFLTIPKPRASEEEFDRVMYLQKLKMYDPKKGNYDTKHERALNRLVSGLPPAIFLANDAYNLSRMMDDDPSKADKEKKTRFRQEVARITSDGYLKLVTLGALQKYINNSKAGIMLLTGITVLFTEMFSRLSNGKYITKLTPEQAREINAKNNTDKSQTQIKSPTAKKSDKPVFTGESIKPSENKNQQPQKPLLSFDTLLKASAVIIAAGYAIKGARKIKSVDNIFNQAAAPFKKFYKNLTTDPNYRIPETKFEKILSILEENGFKKQAEDFRNIAKNHKESVPNPKTGLQENMISFGEKNKRVKIAVDFVIAPFKFAYNTVTLPYRYTDQLAKFIWKNIKKGLNINNTPLTAEQLAKNAVKEKEKLERSKVVALEQAIDRIGREALKKNYDAKKFKSFVCDMTNKAFNVDSLSNLSNSDLSNLAKTATTAATLWFLMTDNYNMVMLKSDGNDVEGANTKFKERFVQEVSRLFYQTLLIDLFNSTFRNQYNRSLAGMSWITLTDTTLGEILTRKSVGTSIKPHTRDELIKIEEKQNNATGFTKGYYNFMKRLTGKRPIRSYEVDNKKTLNFTSQPQQFSQVNFTNNNSILTKMIKG